MQFASCVKDLDLIKCHVKRVLWPMASSTLNHISTARDLCTKVMLSLGYQMQLALGFNVLGPAVCNTFVACMRIGSPASG